MKILHLNFQKKIKKNRKCFYLFSVDKSLEVNPKIENYNPLQKLVTEQAEKLQQQTLLTEENKRRLETEARSKEEMRK